MSNGVVSITGVRWLVLVLLFQLGFLAGLNYQIHKMRELQNAMVRGVAGLLMDAAQHDLSCGQQDMRPLPDLSLTPEEQALLREYTDRAKKPMVY